MSKFCVRALLLLAGAYVAKSDCNYGAYVVFPLLDGECSVTTWPGDWFGSLMSVCDDDTAIIYFYEDNGCESVINYTYPDSYSCGNTGSCDEILYESDFYIGNDDCSGDPSWGIDISLAEVDDECILLFGVVYVSLTVNDNGIFYYSWSGTDCTGTPGPIYNITDVSCTENGGNSSEVSFTEITTADTTDTVSDTTTTTTSMEVTDTSGDDDDECNYAVWFLFPLLAGECSITTYPNDWFGSLMGECDNDDTGIIYFYSDNECENVINYTFVDSFSCGNTGDNCNEIIYSSDYYVGEDDCSGDPSWGAEVSLAGIDDVCVLIFGVSYVSLTVNDNGIFYYTWTGEDCSGTSFGPYNTTNQCMDNGGNSTDISFTEIVSIDTTDSSSSSSGDIDTTDTSSSSSGGDDDDGCNFALFFFFPLLVGECGVTTWPSDWFGSLMAECDDDDTAIIYFYQDNGCENVINYTYASIFSCGNTGDDCDETVYSNDVYIGSQDCTGVSSWGAEVPLASLDNECIDSDSSLSVTVDGDGIFFYSWSDEDCSGTEYGIFNITNECNSDDGNSTQISFTEIVTPDGTGSTTSTTTSNSGGNEDNANGLFNIRGLIVSLIISIAANAFV